MHPVGRNVRLIILNMCIILWEYPARSCNFGGSYYGCCLMMHINFLFAFVVRVQRKSFLQLAIRQAEANIY